MIWGSLFKTVLTNFINAALKTTEEAQGYACVYPLIKMIFLARFFCPTNLWLTKHLKKCVFLKPRDFSCAISENVLLWGYTSGHQIQASFWNLLGVRVTGHTGYVFWGQMYPNLTDFHVFCSQLMIYHAISTIFSVNLNLRQFLHSL